MQLGRVLFQATITVIIAATTPLVVFEKRKSYSFCSWASRILIKQGFISTQKLLFLVSCGTPRHSLPWKTTKPLPFLLYGQNAKAKPHVTIGRNGACSYVTLWWRPMGCLSRLLIRCLPFLHKFFSQSTSTVRFQWNS